MDIKDYLHLYFGCECELTRDEYTFPHGVPLSPYELSQYLKGTISVKPMLRPLSDMTEEERKEIFALVFKREFPKSGSILFFPEITTYAQARYVLWSGIDRLGIEAHGRVWADCDLHHYKHNQHEITRWLLARHFDLFGLIDAGLAIDKTKISTPNPTV
jgi:hypothetical protein